jgi:cysteinyl-tRNA synthetase
MSKSLGNFLTLRDVLGRAPAEAIRLLILRTHYRGLLDFSDTGLAEARQEMDRFYRAMQRHWPLPGGSVPPAFLAALGDDLNTPQAITTLRQLADAALAGDASAAANLRRCGAFLGILQKTPEDWFHGDGDTNIDALVAERIAARKARDFARADTIRRELAEQGIVLEDSAAGTTWRRA